MPTITELGFRPGPLPDTVLPDYHGRGLANVVPTIARHFGLPTPLPPLAEQILPFARLQGVERIVTLLIDALGYVPLTQALAHGRLPALATRAIASNLASREASESCTIARSSKL